MAAAGDRQRGGDSPRRGTGPDRARCLATSVWIGAAPPDRRRPLDSRLARGDHTRLVVLDALLALVDDGRSHPTVPEIAARAGVSARTIHYHFTGIHDVLAAAAAVQAHRHRGLLADIPPVGPPTLRITALCRQRRIYFEAMTPVLLTALARARGGPALGALLDADRALLREQLSHTLAPELLSRYTVMPDLLDAVAFATGWDAWRSLRHTSRRSAPAAERVMALTAYRLVFPRA